MKRIPLLAAAIVPLAVSAGNKDLADWDLSKVKDTQRLSTVLDAEVYTQDGREIGAVHDVVFDRDGQASVLLESNNRLESDRDRTDAAADRDPTTPDNLNEQAIDDFQRRPASQPGEQVTLAKLDWDDVEYDASRDAIMVESEQIEFSESPEVYRAMDQVAIAEVRGEDSSMDEQTRPISNREAPISGDARDDQRRSEQAGGDGERVAGHVLASELLGMEVNLDREESFGRVEDVLLSDQGEAEAFVVDSWDLMDKQRHAIPADIGAVDAQLGAVNLGYTQEELSELEEFDFDDLEASR